MQRKSPDSPAKIVAYYSRSVPKHQRHWPATKLEFIAMHSCLMAWKLYIQGGKRVKIYTDCKSLLNFHTIFSKGNATMQRKLADLAGFDMEIIHISGESNVISDVLSRYDHGTSTKNKFTQTIKMFKYYWT